MIENIGKLTNEELVKIIGEKIIGTESGLNAQQAQAELNRRLINNINNLNSSTTVYSQKLLQLTVILFITALIQIFVSLGSVSASWKEWAIFSALVLYIIGLLAHFIVKNK